MNSAIMLLLLLPGDGEGAVIVAGPFRSVAGQAYTAGSVASEAFTPGSVAGQAYSPGSEAGEAI